MATFLIAMFAAQVALAQAPPSPPKPGPELKRLGYFVGKWKTEGDMKQTPFGPAGKFSSIDTAEWFPGGFFVTMRSVGKSPMGEGHELEVFGYNSDKKVYTYNAFSSRGENESSKGTVQGDTWTWTSEFKVGGKSITAHFIIKEVSPTSYTFKFEMPDEHGVWATVMEGKSTKL